jgi:hypothetical protein
MASFEDFSFQRTARPDRIHMDEPRRIWPWLLLLLVIAGGAGTYVWLRSRPAPQAQTAALPARPTTPPAAKMTRPLGGDPDDIALPPLDQSDALVRTMVQGLSSHPTVLAWLATDGLIRNFTVVVQNIAGGRTPAQQLKVLKPADRFRVSGSANEKHIDPAAYSRYDNIAAAVGALDPQAASRVYATLKPRIEDASRELGEPEPFDGTLEAAIVQLVRVPIAQLPDNAAVRPKGADAYEYVDPKLEALTPAAKVLLRMGPKNARIVQDKLREIGLALGIPGESLK